MTAKNFQENLKVGNKDYKIYSLKKLASERGGNLSRMPKSHKILLENMLRHWDEEVVTAADIDALLARVKGGSEKVHPPREMAFHPARVLMQDFTGVPAVVDLAAMREAVVKLGGDAEKINPLTRVDLVIDHSVSVDYFGDKSALQKNIDLEYQRNAERYTFLKWGQKSFKNLQVVPPGTGICHQVNLESLAQVVWSQDGTAYPDTLVGTDSHTTMINGLAVLGWGVGGIEAEAAMLGQAISMLIPEVIGFELEGELNDGVTATDLVLTVVEKLRQRGVVGKFVEFFGEGLSNLSLSDRATIANMAPEYGATVGIFPVDSETIDYLKLTGRSAENIALVEAYAKEQGLWREVGEKLHFTDTLHLDLSSVVPCLAGPKRPQDRISLGRMAGEFEKSLEKTFKVENSKVSSKVEGRDFTLEHGKVVIAAITSCTNTSNPSVMLGAGILARKAVERGLKVPDWVKTSLAPGSQVVSDYLLAADLQKDLDQLGFQVVGYGCTTCIGNSGPLAPEIASAIKGGDIVAASVLSGNRNFEGRINPHVQANYLASPPLVVAYALAGTVQLDLENDPIGRDQAGKEVYLKDIWPSHSEVKEAMARAISTSMFEKRYSAVFEGDEVWKKVKTVERSTYAWEDSSTFIKHPPYFEGMLPDATHESGNIVGARALLILGDSVTTDHISPAGTIAVDSPAGKYLVEKGIQPLNFNSYGSRRGNHEVMMRGTFANIRIRNKMVPGVEGGYTQHIPSGQQMPVFDAGMKYIADQVPTIVVAGKEYGTGSSRDWAAKGTRLLGVKAVVAESFERIHRSNLIGMGVLPLQFGAGHSAESLGLKGDETFEILGLDAGVKAAMNLTLVVIKDDGSRREAPLLCRIDTLNEARYYQNGGILHYVLRKLAVAN